jgi:hypothetical protein
MSGEARARLIAFGVLALCLGDSAPAEITRPDFSRYDVILLRKPFGEPRPEPQPENTQPATPPPPPFTKSLRLCGITVDGDETRVGFLDIATNPHTSYYLQVGDGMNGIKVISANYDKSSVLLEKDGKQEPLSMDEGAAVPPPTASGGMIPPAMPRMGMANPASPTGTSLADRIRQRREELLRMRGGAMPQLHAAPVAPKVAPPPVNPAPTNSLSAEEREKKLREYNLELIRAKGTKGPPLPIPLTVDEDAQLVKEGVLPPQ